MKTAQIYPIKVNTVLLNTLISHVVHYFQPVFIKTVI